MKNPGHVKPKDKPFPSNDEMDVRGLERENEARGAGLPGEEPRNVQKPGGGVKGQRLGGAHTGRSASRPEADLEDEKPYGRR